jgi:hypothetical protein
MCAINAKLSALSDLRNSVQSFGTPYTCFRHLEAGFPTGYFQHTPPHPQDLRACGAPFIQMALHL